MWQNILSRWSLSNWSRRLGLRPSKRRQGISATERLEDRTLLATLVSATKLTYQDTDGDTVEVSFSKPILTSTAVANGIFAFDTGAVNGSNATKQLLRTINISGIAAASGTTIITKAVRSTINGGDGFAALGQVIATGLDVSTVTIDGDLGRILAGDATTTTQGLGALTVHSMGRYGLLTGATNLDSVIQGKLLLLKSKTDLNEVFINVQGGVNGQIGTVTIGGSLIGGAAGNTGRINAGGLIGVVTITGDMVGGAGAGSGAIATSNKITSVTIGGSLIGGNGDNSGKLFSTLDMGAVKIEGDVIGGAGLENGMVKTSAKLASATIGGSLKGGTGIGSGQVFSTLDMGAANVTGDVVGGTGDESGSIRSDGKLASITIGGSLLGSSGKSTGQVFSEFDMGPVSISGSVIGGAYDSPFLADDSAGAVVSKYNMGNVTIGGSVKGGLGDYSGLIITGFDIGAVIVKGDVAGSSGAEAGRIHAFIGDITSVTINGSLRGGSGPSSGSVNAYYGIGPVKILGNVAGGSGQNSGSLSNSSQGKVTSVFIGGSLIGGIGTGSGRIGGGSELTTLTIQGNIVGGSASGSTNLERSGYVQAQRIGTLTLNGSLISGTDNTTGTFTNNGAIRVFYDIGSATIKGSLIGNTTHKAVISASGRQAPSGTTDLAIGKLTVNGRVEHAQVLAGVVDSGVANNADAQIGPVIVGLDWIASSLVAGATTGADAFYGNSNDAKMAGGVKDVATVFSKITSIVIGGQVIGSTTGGDHFGFVAENIGSLKVKGGTTTFPLVAGNSNDDILLTILFNDTRLNEI